MRVRIIVLAGGAAVVVATAGTFAVIAATAASPPDLGPAVVAPAGRPSPARVKRGRRPPSSRPGWPGTTTTSMMTLMTPMTTSTSTTEPGR